MTTENQLKAVSEALIILTALKKHFGADGHETVARWNNLLDDESTVQEHIESAVAHLEESFAGAHDRT